MPRAVGLSAGLPGSSRGLPDALVADLGSAARTLTLSRSSLGSKSPGSKRLVAGQQGSGGLPDALVTDLQREYSRQLYGQPGRVQPNRLRIIWPSLLRPRVLRSLSSDCAVPERHKGHGSALC